MSTLLTQTKQNTLEERLDVLMRPESPFPLDAKFAKWFISEFLPVMGRIHKFDFVVNPLTEPDGMFHSLLLKNVPERMDDRTPLIEKIELQMNVIAQDPERISINAVEEHPTEVELDPDFDLPSDLTEFGHFKRTPLACIDCKHFDGIKGYWGGKPPCMGVSRLGRGKKGIDEAVYASQHFKFPETEMMRDGTNAHRIAELERAPLKNLDEILKSLAEGKITPFILQFCNPVFGLRGTPDLVIGYLLKTVHGYQLILYFIEDKPFIRSENLVQVGAEMEIVRDGDFLVAPPDTKYLEAIRTKRVPFMNALAQKIALEDDEELSFAGFYMMNPYGHFTNPKDYARYLLKGTSPPDGLKYTPWLYSIDGKLFRYPKEAKEKDLADKAAKLLRDCKPAEAAKAIREILPLITNDKIKGSYAARLRKVGRIINLWNGENPPIEEMEREAGRVERVPQSRNERLYFRVHRMKKAIRRAVKRGIIETAETKNLKGTSIGGAMRKVKLQQRSQRADQPTLEQVMQRSA